MTEASKQRMEECITESFSRSGVTVRDSCRLIYEAGMQDPDANAEKIAKLELENKVLKEAFVYSDRPFRKLLLKNADLFECFDKDIYESEMKDKFGASDVTGTRIFEFRFLKENNSKLQEENKRLRDAICKAQGHIEVFNSFKCPKRIAYVDDILHEALSSGGE